MRSFTAASQPHAFRPSRLAAAAAEPLTELGVERAAFPGFRGAAAWGAGSRRGTRSGRARWPSSRAGITASAPTGLEAAIAEARAEREDDTLESWEALVAFEAESLRRWTPALEEAHRR